MDTKSIINTDRLYWLGRYSERVYTTLKLFSKSFDKLIEQVSEDHSSFCRALEIPNIYSDKDDFIGKYAFSLEDPNSIHTNLIRAYDNAIELREEIGSETLAYIQLALYALEKAEKSSSPLIEIQYVIDAILAFWGIVDDLIEDENTRNIIKVGKRVERIDLFGRLKMSKVDLSREVRRLTGRIARTDLVYRKETLSELEELTSKDDLDYSAIVKSIERIMEV